MNGMPVLGPSGDVDGFQPKVYERPKGYVEKKCYQCMACHEFSYIKRKRCPTCKAPWRIE